jgi:two-component system, NarL family, response regulator LiaR
VKRIILWYGLGGGALIALLKVTEYRFIVVEHSVEVYGGLIALLFASAGIWIGLTLTRPKTKEVVVVRDVPAALSSPTGPFVVNEAKVTELGITPRELEILEQIANGLSTREIAAALFVSENTVKTHASRLFSKLDVNRRTQAVVAGRRLGLIP